MSPFPLDFPGRLLRVYTHLGTHLRGHTATKVKLRLLHSSPPLCVSLAYIIQLPVRLAYSPKQTNGYQLDFMITRPFRYFSFRPFFFSFPFPPPLHSLFRCPSALPRFLHDSERFEEKFENEWGRILFLRRRRTYTFEVLGLIEDCRFSKASFNLIEGFLFFSSAISA